MIAVVQGKVNQFRISSIIVSSIGGGISVEVMFFWFWGEFCNVDCGLSMNMVDRSLWIQHFVRKYWGYPHHVHRGQEGGVKWFFIIYFIFLIFLVFCGGGRVRGEFTIYQ